MFFTNALSLFLPISASLVTPITCLAIESISQRDNNPRSSQTQLASGSAIGYGKISNSLSWQASGESSAIGRRTDPHSMRTPGPLYSGCSLSGVKISDCYQLTLSSVATQNLEDYGSSTPRQRTEFLTASAAAGTTHKYQWSYFAAVGDFKVLA
ncbi:hypothetical protein HHX47_DHR4000314 [Lentinula edodes]|nr:hypothetical protein HHX47_DHR4000314 [Lentinula edodes]